MQWRKIILEDSLQEKWETMTLYFMTFSKSVIIEGYIMTLIRSVIVVLFTLTLIISVII